MDVEMKETIVVLIKGIREARYTTINKPPPNAKYNAVPVQSQNKVATAPRKSDVFILQVDDVRPHIYTRRKKK